MAAGQEKIMDSKSKEDITGRNVIADLALSICKMEMQKYTVILANTKNIENLRTELDKSTKNTVFINAPAKDDQIYIVQDEKTKYSILSEKGIIKKCPEMDKVIFSEIVIMHGESSKIPEEMLRRIHET
ncbi:hypothetical protein [Lacrimispora sp.]|uniref:hypothetical protein n=1 Tax=Lacrimispora sp. TaxID=2719234 RepID=UPI0032E4EC5C